MSENGNGGGAARDVKLDTLVLAYDRAADHLDIGGQFNSIDLALDMLARATRALEARWRMQQIQLAQQAAADEVLRRTIAQQGGRR